MLSEGSRQIRIPWRQSRYPGQREGSGTGSGYRRTVFLGCVAPWLPRHVLVQRRGDAQAAPVEVAVVAEFGTQPWRCARPGRAAACRAAACLTEWREEDAPQITDADGSLITRLGTDARWWTWADYRTNATLAATLPSISDPVQRPTDCYVRLREDLTSTCGESRVRMSTAETRWCCLMSISEPYTA